MVNSTVILQVREMLERHWTPAEIADKICVHVDLVREAIQALSG